MDHHIGRHLGKQPFGVVGDMDAEGLRPQDLPEVLSHHLLRDVYGSHDLHVRFRQNQFGRRQTDRAEAVMNDPDFFSLHWKIPLLRLISF